MAYAHLKYGKMPWKDLVKPAANLARYLIIIILFYYNIWYLFYSQGFDVSLPLAQAVGKMKVEHIFPTIDPGRKITFNALGSLLHQIADISEDGTILKKNKYWC